MDEYNETVRHIQKLFESPYVMHDDMAYIDSLGGGVVLGHRAIKEGRIVASVQFRTLNLNCYEIIKKDFIYNIWIQHELARCYIVFKKYGDGIVEKAVEQGIGTVGLARHLYINYYLEKYAFILSDSIHTRQGKKFWIKLCNELPNDKYKIELVSKIDTKPILAKDVESVFTTSIVDFSRIKISKI